MSVGMRIGMAARTRARAHGRNKYASKFFIWHDIPGEFLRSVKPINFIRGNALGAG